MQQYRSLKSQFANFSQRAPSPPPPTTLDVTPAAGAGGMSSFMTNEEPHLPQALTASRRAIEGGNERDIDKALSDLAKSLGASRIETGSIKALRAVVAQLMTPNMSDTVAWRSHGAGRSTFMKWKARLRDANAALLDYPPGHLLSASRAPVEAPVASSTR